MSSSKLWCSKHQQFRREPDDCPYCKAERLEAENERLRECCSILVELINDNTAELQEMAEKLTAEMEKSEANGND